jgi:radical SAM protein with 4Fe4S-binding SPASM domain
MIAETSFPYAVKTSMSGGRLWQERSPLLGRLDIELTERCNNDCIHCSINLPLDDAGAQRRELRTAEVKAILTEAAALGSLSVRFTGGEPLLRGDFKEIYLFARRLGLKVLLFTNARLITPELAELLASIPPLEPIEVSVYGLRKLSYEAVSRIPGSFAEFWQGVALLLTQRIPFIVKGALLPPNRDEMEAFEAWAATLPAMDYPPRYAMLFDLRGRRNSPKKNWQIQRLRRPPQEVVAGFRRHGSNYLKEMRQFCSKFMGPAGDRLFSCGAGHGPCVDAYGNLQACLLLRHPDTIYNLKSGSLKHGLTHFFPRLRELKATNPDYLVRCARCFLKGLCEQCPSKSWAEHGTLDTPVEYLCQVAHAQAQDLGLIRDRELAWQVKNWQERIAWISK